MFDHLTLECKGFDFDMNPAEIAEAFEVIANAPFDPAEFAFAFAEATDNAKATISKLRSGATNKSDIAGGVLLNRKFYYAPARLGMASAVLDALKASKRTASAKPAILIATDGKTIAAEHPKSGDTLHCAFSELDRHFAFFLPAAGKDRYQAAEENPVDIKATLKLAKLYDALLRTNQEWAKPERRHAINLFMTRLIFCMFSEDVGIFAEDQFSRVVFTYSGNKGESAQETIRQAFTAMNLPKGQRAKLPAWADEFEYVNGGLFAGEIDVPTFDSFSFRYLREACDLGWKHINPDIFGSMMQSIADSKERSELGMHYTSAPNIMKVLGPLFLDDLDAAIEKAWDKPGALQTQMARLGNIRIFDPACGSGNFLVVAYRELREREIRILKRLGEFKGNLQTVMWSTISLGNFHGIELVDFAAETAKLALFIAEYQANARFADVFGQMPALLPLRDGGHIVCGNSLQLKWEDICPPPKDSEEIYIAGNPPFAGAKNQTPEQKQDRNAIFEGQINGYKTLDLVAAWFFIAADYIRKSHCATFALVATSSITQGRQVPALWPHILNDLQIKFAHRPFKWQNNASNNAAVDCVIVGVGRNDGAPVKLYDGSTVTKCQNINAYLVSGVSLYVGQHSTSMFGLPQMIYGAMPNDGGHLILSAEEKRQFIKNDVRSEHFIRPFIGTTEMIDNIERYCLWIEDKDLGIASAINDINDRIEKTRNTRLESTNPETVERAETPHRFWHPGGSSKTHSIIVASASSERREVLPVDRKGADVIASNLCFVIHDAPDWTISIVTSRLHLIWVATVCGKLEARYRYSSTLGWHTFPVPKFTSEQLEHLSSSARRILKTRYQHYPKTIGELYDPEDMPADLRQAHKDNDDLLESMYVGRPFRNDSERLEKLFKLYAAKTAPNCA